MSKTKTLQSTRMGTSQSRGSPPEKESVSPDSDNSSIPDIPSPTIVLQQEPQVQPPVEEPPVEEPPVEEPQVQPEIQPQVQPEVQPQVEEPSVQQHVQPEVEEPQVQPSAIPSLPEQPPVGEPPAPTPDIAVSESQTTTIQTSAINSASLNGAMSDMIRDAIIKYNLPRNVKLSFKLTPVSFKINRESDNKPVSDVIEMAEANPVVVQPASESQPASETEKALETEKIPEVIETRSEDS